MLREAASIFSIIILLLPVYLMSFNLSQLYKKQSPIEVTCERGDKSISVKLLTIPQKMRSN